MHAYRSHSCAALTSANVGDTVRLSGWVHRRRDHGGVIFIDLRDHYGITQVLCDPDSAVFGEVETLRSEFCVRIDGEVKARAPELVNDKLPTGEIEVFIRDLEVLGAAGELPLQVFGDQEYPEETRLAYRYLDLRREVMQDNMKLRSDVVASMRKRMWEKDFREYQTPIITASSPEGARDFLVPSRLHPGKFYALPQAPQQFKQLLMVSGFDKYFQIAPCFRDEDPRADRSPTDFYQLDLEMSFVEQQDVFDTIQPVIQGVFEEFGGGRKVDAEWEQISYRDAAEWYATDKPDLRNPIKMKDVSEYFRGAGFPIFEKILEQKGMEIRAIPAPGGGKSGKFAKNMEAWAVKEGLSGMASIIWQSFDVDAVRIQAEADLKNFEVIQRRFKEDMAKATSKDEKEKLVEENLTGTDSWPDNAERMMDKVKAFPDGIEAKGPIYKNAGIELTDKIREELGLGAGDAVFFVAGNPKHFEAIAAKARMKIGNDLGLTDTNRFAFAWIVDFPIYERDEETGKVDFEHNPFSMPQGGMAALDGDPEDVLGYQYDLACNGYELVSGAIRNHRPEIMFKAFEIAGYGREEVEKRFGGMVNAFQYGAPPHGGCAAGVDRIVMLLADADNLRDVMLFPMNQRAEDTMMGAPSAPENAQLRELGLRVLPAEG